MKRILYSDCEVERVDVKKSIRGKEYIFPVELKSHYDCIEVKDDINGDSVSYEWTGMENTILETHDLKLSENQIHQIKKSAIEKTSV